MNIKEAIETRHSVRSYLEKEIPADIVAELSEEIDLCNAEGSLHIQLVLNEQKAFDSTMAHYGKFSGVNNYIALIGKKSEELDEKLGYYGERLALKAQMLGLNTCWVALTFSKSVTKKICTVAPGEKLVCVLSLGYGATQGVPHKSKPFDTLCKLSGDVPEMHIEGANAAIFAPTATNQQKFLVKLNGSDVKIENLGGFYSKVDLGIVKYHFEAVSGEKMM